MSGRSRHKTHGGIPHGSTLNFGSNLQIYYRWNEGITSESITTTQEDDSTSTTTNVTTWADQSSNANSTYLSDSGGEVLEMYQPSNHRFKTASGVTTIANNDDGGFQTGNDEKLLYIVHRTNGSTGNVIGYKNGKAADSSVTNANFFDLSNLGSKNDASNFFDGKIYDIGVIEGTVSDEYRKRLEDHLRCKHGLERLA